MKASKQAVLLEPADPGKEAIRQRMAGILSRLPRNREDSSAVAERLLGSEIYSGVQVLGCYAASGWEIDLTEVWAAGWCQGKQVALPRWNQESAEYEYALITERRQLVAGRFGVREPSAECAAIDKEALELVLVPGLAFAKNGARLGRGGGYYDRLLQGIRGLRCGVAYESQLRDSLPENVWDQKMDCLLTPNRWVRW